MYQTEVTADVVVIGGGMAGVVAAVAAARGGAKVVLAEANGFLGGTATAAMLGELNGYTHQGKSIYGGLTAELVNGMVAEGFAQLHYAVPMTGNPAVVVDRVRYDPEQLKIFLDKFVSAEGVTVLLHCAFLTCESIDQSMKRVVLGNHYETIAVNSPILIDATGNAEVVYKANQPTWKPNRQAAQATSLIFKMSGVDAGAYKGYPIEEWRKTILSGYAEGFLPAKYCAINLVAGTNDAIINMSRISEVDHESIQDMTRAEVEGRRQISIAVPYLKRLVPGFDKAYLSAIAPAVGVREARRIEGRYRLCETDILSGRKFDDAVAVGCYPMDIHSKNNAVEFTAIGGDGIYTIPFASLLPADMAGVLVAGKCISVDEGAFAAIRTMPTVMAIGEAAGAAAALAHRKNVPPHEIQVDDLQADLKAKGHLQLS